MLFHDLLFYASYGINLYMSMKSYDFMVLNITIVDVQLSSIDDIWIDIFWSDNLVYVDIWVIKFFVIRTTDLISSQSTDIDTSPPDNIVSASVLPRVVDAFISYDFRISWKWFLGSNDNLIGSDCGS